MRLLLFVFSLLLVQVVQAQQVVPVVGNQSAAGVLIPVTFTVSASVPSNDRVEERSSEPLPGHAHVMFIDTFTRTAHPVQIAVTPAEDGRRQIEVEMRFPDMQAFRNWFDLDETQHIIATLAGDGNVSGFEYALAMDANVKP